MTLGPTLTATSAGAEPGVETTGDSARSDEAVAESGRTTGPSLLMAVREPSSPDTLRLEVLGRLDLGLARSFRSVARAVGPTYPRVVVDLAEAGEVFDSGVALLLVLARRLRQCGATLEIVNWRRRLSPAQAWNLAGWVALSGR